MEFSQDDINRQAHINSHPLSIGKNQMAKIFEQMSNSVVKIRNGDINGTGFICLIPFPDEIHRLPVLITCNHVLNIDDIIKIKKKEITLFLEEREITMRLNDDDRKIYCSRINNYDITIIEIKEGDYLYENEFLEIDNDIYDDNLNKIFKDKTVYIIHYPKGGECEYTLDTISRIDVSNTQIVHFCTTEDGSSGGPILNLKTFKVIGIHIGEHKSHKYNIGIVIKHPIDAFNKNFPMETDKNEITISIQIRDEDVKKEIYFLDNYIKFDEETKKIHEHDNLKELNNNNVKIYIDEVPYKFCKYFIPKEKGMYTIRIIFNILMKDCSYMFYNCENIRNINLSLFDAQKVTHMNHMFSHCYNLLNVNLLRLNTKSLINMSYMFCSCESLTKIDLSSFNTENVLNMEGMFFYCLKLAKINVLRFNTSKVIDMSRMFNLCPNLIFIDLSSFELGNKINMNEMFMNSNVINIPPPSLFAPEFEIRPIKTPGRVKVNEKSYDKFLKILDKDVLYKL